MLTPASRIGETLLLPWKCQKSGALARAQRPTVCVQSGSSFFYSQQEGIHDDTDLPGVVSKITEWICVSLGWAYLGLFKSYSFHTRGRKNHGAATSQRVSEAIRAREGLGVTCTSLWLQGSLDETPVYVTVGRGYTIPSQDSGGGRPHKPEM